MKTQLWNLILEEIEDQIDPQTFSTWFDRTKQFSLVDHTLTIKAPTKFFADWLDQHYKAFLEETAYNLTEKNINIEFIGTPTNNHNNQNKLKKDLKAPDKIGLNQRYTFNRFIVGDNSQFAYSASHAVANKPGKIYNPLFIYGGVGLGKTHLMQAIGNYIYNNSRNKRISYIASEDFTNQMIASIQNNDTINFRKKFRNYDVLMIDDIQFLAGKEGSQEEFFHTFNTLYNAKKQIVLTSDRPPKEIKKLQDRLISRFEWGLLADLKKPNYETRAAILKQKCKEENVELDHEIIEFIAENCHDNIRQLEGSLIKILAYTSYKNIDPSNLTLDEIKDRLGDILISKNKPITMELIQEKVASYFKIGKNQIKENTRKKEIAFPRQIAMYLSTQLLPDISLNEIAHHYNKKDHSTIIYAKKNIIKKMNDDTNLKAKIDEITETIRK